MEVVGSGVTKAVNRSLSTAGLGSAGSFGHCLAQRSSGTMMSADLGKRMVLVLLDLSWTQLTTRSC